MWAADAPSDPASPQCAPGMAEVIVGKAEMALVSKMDFAS
jgi:hypothetical protein